MTVTMMMHADGGGGINNNEDNNFGVMDENTVQMAPALDIRARREHKENVRYSSQEYDLSEVSNNQGRAILALSSMYIHPNAGKLTQKKMKQRSVKMLFLLA